jgi:3-dehydrosphinganine reductase
MTRTGNYFGNKTVIITGGSSGIGLALAKELTGHGARVWLLARQKDRLSAAQDEIGLECRTVSVDVSDWEQVKKTIGQVIHVSGVPDILINSAGMAHPGYVQDLDMDIFRSMMDINYFGTVHVVKAILPGMLERGSGHIVNISSIAGYLGVFGYSAYGASKYAVRGFSDVLRSELKPHGIRVSVVFPPDTDTPGLAYEVPFKPLETKALSGSAKVMSAEAVAATILRGVQRGKYVILPGFDAKFFFSLSNLLGNGVYPVMDWMIRDARRKAGKK